MTCTGVIPGGRKVSLLEVEPGVNLFYENRGDGPIVCSYMLDDEP